MKLSAILLAPLSLAAVSSAWKLELFATDGRKVTASGRDPNSGCKNIAFTPVLNVNRAKFNKDTSFLPDPKTFELFVNKNCQGLSYRNGDGNHRLTPARKIRSYRVKK
ncbi:hypothetical protein B0T21DRAFT_382531 [Apiosordaria backusii]|uniref:Uncharacterized protein n=1 Tax=Apiosordaria backusii TaxID=314023 RepID=A0AA40BSB9_9PEZI|nr:hypothetical protein B0T21DRAFT_382531 [Apiosordaria backusii]